MIPCKVTGERFQSLSRMRRHVMTGYRQGMNGRVEILFAHQQIVRVEGSDRKNRNVADANGEASAATTPTKSSESGPRTRSATCLVSG